MSAADGIDQLVYLQAKLSETQLSLAMARHFVRSCEIDPNSSDEFKTLAREVRERAECLLDGTIHSFTPNGARR